MADEDDLLDEEFEAVAQDRVTPRRELACKLAAEMLVAHRITAPPVDVFAIARALDFEVKNAQLPPAISGQLTGRVIEINRTEPLVRRRFTVAHELGHHAIGTVHGVSAGSYQRAFEREADIFAGELLVPRSFLRAQNTSDETTLRRAFFVSRDTLRIAAANCHFKLID